MPWGSLWRHRVDLCWKCWVLANVWKAIDVCWFFMGWRVSGETWMISLGGLGYEFAGWKTAGGIWRCLGGKEAAWGNLRSREHDGRAGALQQPIQLAAGCNATRIQDARLQDGKDGKGCRMQDCKIGRIVRCQIVCWRHSFTAWWPTRGRRIYTHVWLRIYYSYTIYQTYIS